MYVLSLAATRANDKRLASGLSALNFRVVEVVKLPETQGSLTRSTTPTLIFIADKPLENIYVTTSVADHALFEQ